MINKLKYIYLALIFSILFSATSFNVIAENDVHSDDIIVGNVICLLPDVNKGTVKPVIATGPCNNHGPHSHVIFDTRNKVGNVFAVQGTPEARERLEKTAKRNNVKVKGRFNSDQSAWILSDDQ